MLRLHFMENFSLRFESLLHRGNIVLKMKSVTDCPGFVVAYYLLFLLYIF